MGWTAPDFQLVVVEQQVCSVLAHRLPVLPNSHFSTETCFFLRRILYRSITFFQMLGMKSSAPHRFGRETKGSFFRSAGVINFLMGWDAPFVNWQMGHWGDILIGVTKPVYN